MVMRVELCGVFWKRFISALHGVGGEGEGMLERLLIVQTVRSTGLYALLDYTFQCDLIDHSSNGS